MDSNDVKQKEDDAMHPTREQFDAAFERLHDKLDANKDHFTEQLIDLSTEVTEIRTKVELTPQVTLPSRPCPFFKEHEQEHDKIKYMWLKSIIGAIVSAIVTVLGALFLFIHKGRP